MRRCGIAGLLIVIAGCASGPNVLQPGQRARDFLITGTPGIGGEWRSPNGVVAAATREAASAGAEILGLGGNAVDAAVATGFALAVTEPSMSGLGGRASILIRQADGTVIGVDGLNQIPQRYRAKSGLAEPYERAAIPGVPAALGYVLEQHGTMSLAEVLAPAIRLAQRGFILSEAEAGRWAAARAQLLEFGAGRGTYLKEDGTLWQAGDRVPNPLLAATLRRLATDGVDSFYRGDIAAEIDADMRARGAFLTREDLAGYEARPAIVVRGTYRDRQVVANFRPAAGHAVIQALHTLELLPVPGRNDDVRWAAVVGQAMHWALADRSTRHGSEEDSAARLTSRAHAAERASRVKIPPASDAIERHDEPWQSGGFFDPPGTLITADTDREATSHFSVADATGRVVAITQSLGPSMGTRLVAPGLGFLYATRLGTVPGSRPMSTVAPTILISPSPGNEVIALGAAGDSRIISAVIQVISRLVDHGMSLVDAVGAARVHPDEAQVLRIEDGPTGAWSPRAREQLTSWGFTLVPSSSGFFGRVHAVRFDPNRHFAQGVPEPRWTGGAAAPSPILKPPK
jgi:gamma-glutamyltranspeptidase/glutathione hydrolase